MADEKERISAQEETVAAQELENAVKDKLFERYGDNIPLPVSERVNSELKEMRRQGCAQKFLSLSHLSDNKNCNTNHAILRGTDSNYEILFQLGITELDPMERHIMCNACGHWEQSAKALFEADVCPNCGSPVVAEGLGLPYADIAISKLESELSVSSQTGCCYTESLKALNQKIVFDSLLKQYGSHAAFESNDSIAVCFYPHTGLNLISACEKETGIPTKNISLSAPEVYEFISSLINDSFKEQQSLAVIACKEFGLEEYAELIPAGIEDIWQDHLSCMPMSNFDELVSLWGLLHGTGTFFENGEELVKKNVISARQILCCREDVLDYLISHGMDINAATQIMECVRKGKVNSKSWLGDGICGFTYEQWVALDNCGVEAWFIESCQKIKYLFPRGHCAAFSANLVRLLWYVIHTPEAAEKAFASICKDNVCTA